MFSMQSVSYNPLIATFQLSSAASWNLGQSQNGVIGNVLSRPTVKQLPLLFVPTDCIDSDGNTRSHLEEWTTTTGSCDRHICYSTSLENKRWKVSHEYVL